MNHRWTTVALSCLIIFALVAALGLGCGKGGEEKGKVTITIGHISDMTGPASPALVPITYAVRDLASYFSETIPGVNLKVVEYDDQYNPSRDVPGYDWVRSKGAQVVIGALPTLGETLKSFAERDKVPYFSMSSTKTMIDPPGWVFCNQVPGEEEMGILLQWLSENDWDYSEGTPKIGAVGWAEPATLSYHDGIRQYVQGHSDKFTLGALRTAPMGVSTWTAEVAATKDCDYVLVPSTGTSITTFQEQYRAAGGKAKFIWNGAQTAYIGLIVNALGWDAIDGIPMTISYLWWTDTGSQLAALANELLDTYRPEKADSLRRAGTGYLAGVCLTYPMFDIIAATVERVGAKNVTGQAIYDTAITYDRETPDGQGVSFTAGKRAGFDYMVIYRVDAAKRDMVRASDWLPYVAD
jgi:ABC-type branched-subunit amino acid transport system substrate-binding protein